MSGVVIVKSAGCIPLFAAVWALKNVAVVSHSAAVYAARFGTAMVIWLAGAGALDVVQ
jgi:hypothetical protein